MDKQKTPLAMKLTVFLASLALLIAIFTNFDVQQTKAQLEDVTDFNGIKLKQSTFGTATPQLEIYNQGNGQSLVIRDSNGTPEVYVDADGGMTVNDLTSTSGGNVDLNGNTLVIDADADTTLVASDDDIISTTLGAATGELKILTGNLVVGNGTEDTTLNGEDAYIEGTLEVDGAVNLDGAVDMGNNIISNIGAAGTDFGSDGSLTTAQTITATAGGINVVSGGLTVTAGGATVTAGGLTVNGGLSTFSGGVNCTPQAEAVTAGWTITPTSCIISLTSTAEVTSSTTTGVITTSATTGDIVILANNNASDVIHIDGTGGTVECKADVALGASDTLMLWYNGTDSVWNCLSNYDNS